MRLIDSFLFRWILRIYRCSHFWLNGLFMWFAVPIDRCLKKWWGGESSSHFLRDFLMVIWHGLRLPVTLVYGGLRALGVLAHNVKRLIGNSIKGFSWFLCRFTGFRVSDAILSRGDEIALFYKQGASKQRIGLSFVWWFGWIFFMGIATAYASVTTGKYGISQVFDAQRSPAYPSAGQSFTVSSLQRPFYDNFTAYTLGAGEYIQFFYVNGTCNGGKVGIKRYEQSEQLIETISPSGEIWGLEQEGFLYVSDNSNIGTFISNNSGNNYEDSVTYTTTTSFSDCILLNNYVASSTPRTTTPEPEPEPEPESSTGGSSLTQLRPTMTLFVKLGGVGSGTVKSNPSGIDCKTEEQECQATFATNTLVELTATPDTGSEFSSWGGHSDCGDAKVTLTGNILCNVFFKLGPRTLTISPTEHGTISSQPEGILCGPNNQECEFEFNGSSNVTLSVTPVAGWRFDNWEGDCNENGAVTMDSNQSCTANFVNEHSLTLTTEGQGTIEDCATECTQTHLNDETLQLSATPAKGWQFSNWSGDCDNGGNITMNSDKSCTAHFIQIFTLTVTLIGSGTVTSEEINCGDNCTADYLDNTSVALTAQPDMEWVFENFSEGCDSNVQMTSDKNCIATFVEDANIPNNGDGNVDGIPDTQQNNVVTIPDQVDGEYLTLEVEPTCSIDDAYTDLPGNQGEYDQSYQFPQGTMYFELGCAETDVTVYFHALQRAQNPILQKYGPTNPGDLTTLGWYTIPDVTYGTVTIDGKSVVTATYHLIDGELGDNTGVDGRIIDPMGLAFSFE